MAHNFGAGSSATSQLQGSVVHVGTRPAAEQLPDLEVAAPFLLTFHPHRWMLVEGEDGEPELLPELGQIPVDPGVGNVDEFGDPSVAMARKTRKDWLVLPEAWATPEDTPDRAAGYVRAYRGRRGTLHVTAWQRVKVVAGRAIYSSDQDGYRGWLRRLLAEGKLPQPDPDVVEAMLDRARGRADRAGARDRDNSVAARLARQAAERVEALERLASDAGVEMAPEPTPVEVAPETVPEAKAERKPRAKKETPNG